MFLDLYAIAVYCKHGNISVSCHSCFSHFLNAIGEADAYDGSVLRICSIRVSANLILFLQQTLVQDDTLKEVMPSKKTKPPNLLPALKMTPS